MRRAVAALLSASSPCIRTYASKAAPRHKPKPQLSQPRLDYTGLLASPEATARNVADRALPLDKDHVDKLREARAKHLEIERQLNAARAEHGAASSVFRDKHKKRDKKDAIAHARALKDKVIALEADYDAAEAMLLDLALGLPNFSHSTVPVGAEHKAEEVDRFGPEPIEAAVERDHVRIAETFGWLDSAASAIATGSSWPYLMGGLAHLEHALVGYALSAAVRKGYVPVSPPDVVSADVARRCGFQPRDGVDGPRQTYFLEKEGDEPQLCLTGTAEIPLAALWANRILYRAALPTRVVGVGRAFRAEAGARGADTRGLYRVHQFTKVELFSVTPENGESDTALEEMRALQREIVEGLGLTVRVLNMPTQELGASASKKYDMEAWMPGRGKWGEITSASNCTDYQSRRLHIRYRDGDAGVKFAHTLNGTAAAVPRLIVALLENGVRLGSNGEVEGVDLPACLKPFWVGPEAFGEGDGVVRFV